MALFQHLVPLEPQNEHLPSGLSGFAATKSEGRLSRRRLDDAVVTPRRSSEVASPAASASSSNYLPDT